MNNKSGPWLQTLIPLLIVTLICTLVLVFLNKYSSEQIVENSKRQQLKIIEEVITSSYDNDIYKDVITIDDPGIPGNKNRVQVFRLRMNNNPVGIVLLPVSAKGYNSNILLAIGINYEGILTGVRVTRHSETAGLGDGVDQNRSDWIKLFDQLSLTNTLPENWAVISEGGKFDQLSGATVTSRGVINTIRKTLEYYQSNRDKLFANE